MGLRLNNLTLCSLILIIAATSTATATPTSITIGDTIIESTNDSGNGNLLVAQKATLGQTATIQSLSFYVNVPHGKLRLGLYADNAGSPGALLASTNEFTPSSTGWNTQNVVSPLSLTAGTYWLAYLPQSDLLGFKVSNYGSGTYLYTNFRYRRLPATFPGGTWGAAQWSFSATLNTDLPPIAVELAEKTPPADPGDPTMSLAGPPSTTTTTTTTTTLPTIPRCPDAPIAGAETGSYSGYNYWAFDPDFCSLLNNSNSKFYCFVNPWVDLSGKNKYVEDWEDITPSVNSEGGYYLTPCAFSTGGWESCAALITGAAAEHPDDCYICGCFRAEGCFAPGVKITMADGSLRKIEDVRAGDMVRNVKTGAAVKVGKVIEGPETLPLIRFGFDGATVTTSQAHPVLTATGLKPANQLKKGDTVFDAQGNPHPVTILETLPLEEGQRVINVNLDAASSDTDQRLIVSDGIITGDIVLQGLLKERK